MNSASTMKSIPQNPQIGEGGHDGRISFVINQCREVGNGRNPSPNVEDPTTEKLHEEWFATVKPRRIDKGTRKDKNKDLKPPNGLGTTLEENMDLEDEPSNFEGNESEVDMKEQ
ncbi:hypothetical protein RJT34_23442 [Clitoria ternatea]|uniref:Uncharacterized protein n=1 Tax=Clitoria ternatea TaxID=43366 RepID=A0AAN9FL54_CLITE